MCTVMKGTSFTNFPPTCEKNAFGVQNSFIIFRLFYLNSQSAVLQQFRAPKGEHHDFTQCKCPE